MESMLSKVHAYLAEYLGDKTVTPILLASVVIVLSVLYCVFKNRDSLPGPYSLPLLGYEPFFKEQTMHLSLVKMQKKYGDLFTFKFAGATYINMGSVKAVRDLHVAKADCFERCSDFSLLTLVFGDGVGFINGEPWKVLRKFTLQQFRQLGMTTMKDAMSGPMYDCIQETVEFLRSKKGELVEITQMLTDKCNAILRRTMFGDGGITEKQVRELNECYASVMSFMTVKNLLYAGTFARYFRVPFRPGYRQAMRSHRTMEKMLIDIVNDHKTKFNEEHPRDFIDAYFKERNERRSRGDPTAEYFTGEMVNY